jgi:transposase
MSRNAPEIALDPSDRAALERSVRSPHTPQGVANRARIVLAAAEGLSNQQIAERLHISCITVGKWRASYHHSGISGLQGFKPTGRPSKYNSKLEQRLRSLLCQRPWNGRRRWTVRVLARHLDIPPSTLHDILRKMRLPRSRYLPWRAVRA